MIWPDIRPLLKEIKNLFAGLSPYRFKLTQNCNTRYEAASHLTFNEKTSPILS